MPWHFCNSSRKRGVSRETLPQQLPAYYSFALTCSTSAVGSPAWFPAISLSPYYFGVGSNARHKFPKFLGAKNTAQNFGCLQSRIFAVLFGLWVCGPTLEMNVVVGMLHDSKIGKPSFEFVKLLRFAQASVWWLKFFLTRLLH